MPGALQAFHLFGDPHLIAFAHGLTVFFHFYVSDLTLFLKDKEITPHGPGSALTKDKGLDGAYVGSNTTDGKREAFSYSEGGLFLCTIFDPLYCQHAECNNQQQQRDQE
jgi:hypothetical protein